MPGRHTTDPVFVQPCRRDPVSVGTASQLQISIDAARDTVVAARLSDDVVELSASSSQPEEHGHQECRHQQGKGGHPDALHIQ